MRNDDDTLTDERISATFHSSTAEIEPDVAALVRGGLDRGRARRRRRTVGTAFVAAGAVGVVGLAASLAPGFDRGGAGFDAGPAAGPVSVTTPVASATQPKSKPTQAPTIPTADIPVKAADLPRLFTKLYPGKVTLAEPRTGRIIDDGDAGQYAHFLWKGFTTSVGFVAFSGTPIERCREVQQDAVQSGGPRVACVKRPNGTVSMSVRDTAPALDGGGRSQGATLFTDDGYEIFVISYNTAKKAGPPLAEEPPLSMNQLINAVTSDVWF